MLRIYWMFHVYLKRKCICWVYCSIHVEQVIYDNCVVQIFYPFSLFCLFILSDIVKSTLRYPTITGFLSLSIYSIYFEALVTGSYRVLLWDGLDTSVMMRCPSLSPVMLLALNSVSTYYSSFLGLVCIAYFSILVLSAFQCPYI